MLELKKYLFPPSSSFCDLLEKIRTRHWLIRWVNSMRSQRTGIIQLWWRWMRKMRWVFVFARNWADPLGLGAQRTEKSEFRWVNGGESRAERRKLEMGFGEMSWRRWIQKPLHGFFGEFMEIEGDGQKRIKF